MIELPLYFIQVVGFMVLQILAIIVTVFAGMSVFDPEEAEEDQSRLFSQFGLGALALYAASWILLFAGGF